MKIEEDECFYCKQKTNVRVEEIADWITRYVCWECDLKNVNYSFRLLLGLCVLVSAIIIYSIKLYS